MSPNGPLRLAPAESSWLASIAGVIAAVAIVLYQAWLMPFFQPFFTGRVALARVVFYALYGSLVVAAIVVLGTRANIRRRVTPFIIVAVVLLAVTFLHPIGIVTRAYIVALVVGGATMVLMLGAGSGALLELSAAVTALGAILCFVDLLFSDGFASVAGRAAGLALNPNSAAAAILLGAAASYRAVPRRLQLSFFVLTAGAIAVTESRSTILAAAAAIAIPAAIEIWRRARATPTEPFLSSVIRRLAPGAKLATVVAVALLICVGTATTTNDRFRLAVRETVGDSLSFAGALVEAREAIAADQALDAAVAGMLKSPDAARLAALDARLLTEGQRNSASARTLFLERALLVYRENGFFGMGLEAAHPLVPHNTFVLFALAFGYVGWIIPLAPVALALYAARDARDLPLAVAAVGTMAMSHDILLTPSLFLPIAVGLAGMLGRGQTSPQDARVRRSVAFAVVASVLLFAAGCVAIIRTSSSLTVERINPTAMAPYHGAYLATLPAQTFPGLFVPAVGNGPGDNGTFMHDDSRPLTRVSWKTGVRPAVAPGEYAVAYGSVEFAPADGSDPRTNGHDVDLGLPRTVGAPFFALLAALATLCAALVWRQGVSL